MLHALCACIMSTASDDVACRLISLFPLCLQRRGPSSALPSLARRIRCLRYVAAAVFCSHALFVSELASDSVWCCSDVRQFLYERLEKSRIASSNRCSMKRSPSLSLISCIHLLPCTPSRLLSSPCSLVSSCPCRRASHRPVRPRCRQACWLAWPLRSASVRQSSRLPSSSSCSCGEHGADMVYHMAAYDRYAHTPSTRCWVRVTMT